MSLAVGDKVVHTSDPNTTMEVVELKDANTAVVSFKDGDKRKLKVYPIAELKKV